MSAGLFALALASFYLPGATASDCFGDHTNFTGADLVVHRIPRESGPIPSYGAACDNPPSKFTSGATPVFATVALIAAAVGLVLAVARTRRGIAWCAAVGLFAILLPGFGSLSPLDESPDITLHVGADLALLAFASVLFVSAALALTNRPLSPQQNPPDQA